MNEQDTTRFSVGRTSSYGSFPSRAMILALALVGCAVTGDAEDEDAESTDQALEGEVSIFADAAKPVVVSDPDNAAVEVGVRFRSDVAGALTGLRFYKSRANKGTHVGHLWSNTGGKLAEVTFTRETRSGWQVARFAQPVAIQAGVTYVASYHTTAGHYSATTGEFASRSVDRAPLHALRDGQDGPNGVYRYGAAGFPTSSFQSTNYFVDVVFKPSGGGSTPTMDAGTGTDSGTDAGTGTDAAPPPPPPPPSTGFPDATNTGVPAGTTLTKYSGPCTITSTTTITAVDASACAAISIRAPNVVITKSLLPRIDATAGGSASVTVSDSTVRAGAWVGGAIWGYNITATRVNVTGGQHSFHCADTCTVTDSWLHDQYNPDGQSFHNNAFITNGGSNMVVRHNTLHCTALLNATDGGCTADLSLFGDFDPVTNVTVEGNLMKANASSISFCAYGGYSPSKPYPIATGIAFRDNVFERGSNGRCGVYGPVTSFQATASGNVWTNNKFDDGTVINP